MEFSFTTFAVLAMTGFAAASPACIGADSKPVDHWYSLKAPNGNNTYYWGEGDTELTHSERGMGGIHGAIPETLAQFYEKMPKSYAWAMYNDQSDVGKKLDSHAHAKGVIMFDGTQGFWLIHSLPKFPSRPSSGYKFLPDWKYGQSFMCITFSVDKLGEIATQLKTAWPQVYDSGMSSDMEKKYPEFKSLIDGEKGTEKEMTTPLESLGGTEFTHFSKSKEAAVELYSDMVAPGLKADLMVETWMNGAIKNKIIATCKSDGYKYTVTDVNNVTTADGTTWKETQDHSKWAITVDDKISTVCVGDINRQKSQNHRGGGTMCLQNAALWKSFNSIINGVMQTCKK